MKLDAKALLEGATSAMGGFGDFDVQADIGPYGQDRVGASKSCRNNEKESLLVNGANCPSRIGDPSGPPLFVPIRKK